MNYAAVAAVTSIIGCLVTLCVGAFIYGQLTQQVKDNRERVDELAVGHTNHSLRLEDHSSRIVRLEEWKRVKG